MVNELQVPIRGTQITYMTILNTEFHFGYNLDAIIVHTNTYNCFFNIMFSCISL